jgi:uncharacterized protein YciI
MQRILRVMSLLKLAAVAIALSLPALPQTTATNPPAPYCFGFLRSAPDRVKLPQNEAMEIQKQHLGHLGKMSEEGKLLSAGPLVNSPDLRGVVIFQCASVDEAKAWASEDPAVKANQLWVDLYTWPAAARIGERYRAMRRADPAFKGTMVRYQLALLVKSPSYPAPFGPAFQQSLYGHRELVNRLQSDGKILAAAPFLDSEKWMGAVIYNAGSLDAAKALAAEDPFVKAGHVTVEAYEWFVAKETLPEAN